MPIMIGVIILIVLGIVLSMWKKVPQDKAIVVTGLKKRVISGGGGIVIPILERTDKISLENMKIEVRIGNALTEQGVGITADGVSVIKVKSDHESVLAAIEQFNTGNEEKTIAIIKDTSKDVLEGKLREIVSKMTVEEIYKDREMFAARVQEVAAIDLDQMGLEIKTFTIRDISDENGYLKALGKGRIAEVKRDADIAEAEAQKETKIKTSEAFREGEAAKLIAETSVSESMKNKELKVQAYRKDQETSKAVADLAYEIEANKVKKEVTETEMMVQIIRKQKEIELAEQESLRKEKELEATVKKESEADKYQAIQEAQAKAEAIKLEGEAKAEAMRLEGMAKVEIIRETGKAEAEAMMKKAEAFKQYNEAAVLQMVVEKLPDLAKAIAEPLAKTEKIVIIDGGKGESQGGASKVAGYVTDIMTKVPETVKATTGIDLLSILKGMGNREELNDKEIEEVNKEVIIEEHGIEE
ncbi:flotillin family protein [Clostridium sp. MSJ-4]|uniref:Flotillin family protein n=1 Tax=Clostridium simiarum TaxID=2841506 RepID=A0ABS6EZ43_9CLOT|nr:SPFH domain-containing protein [Clostridium simiarum]MBU5591486.1 flotillin family protein [Clostridium simiarum]